MKKILLGMAVLTALFTTNLSANAYQDRLTANIAAVYTDVSMLINKHTDTYNGNTTTSRAHREAFKIKMENCGASVSFSIEDALTGSNKTVDLWSFVKNGGDYVRKNSDNKEKLLQYFVFITKPKAEFVDMYNKKGLKDFDAQHNLYMSTIINHYKKNTTGVSPEFTPFGAAFTYACQNNNLTNSEIGLSSEIYEDFIYKMSVRDFDGVDKILDSINFKAKAFALAMANM